MASRWLGRQETMGSKFGINRDVGKEAKKKKNHFLRHKLLKIYVNAGNYSFM